MDKREYLISRGGRLKTRLLIEQASYTLALAQRELTILEEVGLSAEFLSTLDTITKEVISLEAAQEQAKNTLPLNTEAIGDKVTEAKQWIKKARLKAKRAFRFDKTILDDFFNGPPIKQSVPNAITQIGRASCRERV